MPKLDLSQVKPDLKGKKVVIIDPGDHIGIIVQNSLEGVWGCTIVGAKRNLYMYQFLDRVKPDIVAYEQFALRAAAAKKMVGNKFFTCEVIGVIKMYCFQHNLGVIELFPGCKEYCGFSDKPKDPHYEGIRIFNRQMPVLAGIECENKITEHVRDAYRLYTYYKLFGARFK